MNLKKALDFCTYYLRDKNIDEADFKALCLVCYVAKIKNSEFYFNQSREIDANALEPLLLRLENGEPLQYIIGKWDFYESEFHVGNGVLIPRPETEELVELAVSYAKKINEPVIYDLCSGSGAIAVSIAKIFPDSDVVALEYSDLAVEYLKKNIELNGADNVKVFKGDVTKCYGDFSDESFDLVISNPPYIESDEIDTLQPELQFEPRMALDGGKDGLYFYRIISEKWSCKVKKGGMIAFEVGEEQFEPVAELVKSHGFENVTYRLDLQGYKRTVAGVRTISN